MQAPILILSYRRTAQLMSNQYTNHALSSGNLLHGAGATPCFLCSGHGLEEKGWLHTRYRVSMLSPEYTADARRTSTTELDDRQGATQGIKKGCTRSN